MGSVRSAAAVVLRFGVALMLVLSACGGVPASVGSGEPPKIGVIVANMAFSFAHEQSDGFQAGAKIAGGVQPMVGGPDTYDRNQQVNQVRDMTARATGGVAVSTSVPAFLAGPFEEATARGVPLILLGGRSTPASGARLLIENDNYELGRMLAEEAINRLPPEVSGKVVVGTTAPAHPALDERTKGIRDELARKRPAVRVTGPFDTQRDQPLNLASWQVLVAANPDAVAFLGTGDIDAINLAAVRGNTHASWLAGGFSVDPKVLQAVHDGRLFAVISPEHFLKGAIAGWLLAQHAKGVRALPEGWLSVPGVAITSANVDDVMRRQSSPESKLAPVTPQIDAIDKNTSRFLRPLDQAR